MSGSSDIDVTELFSDPDFCTAFSMVRTTVTRGDDGEAVTAAVETDGLTGNLDMTGATLNVRGGDAQLQEGELIVLTTTLLTSGSGPAAYDPAQPIVTTDADVLTIFGRRYRVTKVDRFLQWGTPFVRARCMLLDINLQAGP